MPPSGSAVSITSTMPQHWAVQPIANAFRRDGTASQLARQELRLKRQPTSFLPDRAPTPVPWTPFPWAPSTGRDGLVMFGGQRRGEAEENYDRFHTFGANAAGRQPTVERTRRLRNLPGGGALGGEFKTVKPRRSVRYWVALPVPQPPSRVVSRRISPASGEYIGLE